MSDKFLCAGCTVEAPFEHRCHGKEISPDYITRPIKPCECTQCKEPTQDELKAFMRREGLCND